jgi:phosphoribosylformylglycinamidine cyclo-ligase
MGVTYSSAGVSVTKVKSIHRKLWGRIAKTFKYRRGEMGGPVGILGHYGGLFSMGGRLLAIHTDGVGTKVLVAQALEKYDTVGIDGMAMSVNDIICLGAEPLVVIDYLALSKEDPYLVDEVMKGLVKGAKESGVAIVGGETAIIPEVIKGGRRPFDLAVSCVGAVDKDKLITGERMETGDVIIGLESSGLHSNGYTLARRALDMKRWGNEMLTPTRIYVKPVLQMIKSCDVHGIAHITGGAFSKLMRIGKYAGKGFLLDNMPKPKPIFEELGRRVKSDYEMYRTFNMGVGMCIVCNKRESGRVIEISRRHGINARVIGKITGKRDVILEKDGKRISLL